MNLLIDPGAASIDMMRAHGNGVRISEIAATLSAHHQVRVLADRIPAEPLHLGCAEIVIEDGRLDEHLGWCEAVFFFDSPDRPRLEAAVRSGRRIISECRPPIEQFDYPSIKASDEAVSILAEHRACYVEQIRRSHFFISRSKVERLTTIGAMVAVGKIGAIDISASRSLDHLMATVPVGFSQRSKARADLVKPRFLADFLWTGGMWDFFRPEAFIRGLAGVRDRGRNVTGAFLHATPNPDTAACVQSIRELVHELELDTSVRLITEPLRHDDRDAFLLGSKALVCLSSGGIENESTVRFRLRDTLLHGVPLIVDGGGGTSDAVLERNLGVVVPFVTSSSVADAMQDVLDAPPRSMNLQGVAYEETLQPVLRYLEEIQP